MSFLVFFFNKDNWEVIEENCRLIWKIYLFAKSDFTVYEVDSLDEFDSLKLLHHHINGSRHEFSNFLRKQRARLKGKRAPGL